MDAQQQELVAQFSGITGASPSSAQTALASANWNLEEAVGLYFAAQEGEPIDDEPELDGTPSQPSQPSQPTAAQPAAASSSSSRNPPAGQRPKQMTLDDLKKREDGDDDSDEDEDKKQNMFAGGEKSGLAVQNPNQGNKPTDHFKNILNQAKQNRDRPPTADGEERPAGSSNFRGPAQTLGGDDAPSQVVQDPTPQRPQALPRVTRTLHLWADGISIDDGELFRFDDPANQSIMQEINQGRAPLALLNVAPGQEVDLNLDPHKDQNYVQPKKKYKSFAGSGQRLGSPTPGASASAPAPAASAPVPAAASSPAAADMKVDESQPTLRLQIRLGDGTRLSSQFNTTHTIGDVYEFVARSSPASAQRPFALMTTFPSRELEDRKAVLGEMADFKRGGVVVQKWKDM